MTVVTGSKDLSSGHFAIWGGENVKLLKDGDTETVVEDAPVIEERCEFCDAIFISDARGNCNCCGAVAPHKN